MCLAVLGMIAGLTHDAREDSGVLAHSYRDSDAAHEKLKLVCRMYGVKYLRGTPGEVVARLK